MSRFLDAGQLDTYAIPRLNKVVVGEDPGGITEAVEWEGGGGFRILDVAPSMFEEDGGVPFLADWATNGKLAEAVAAQMHFDFQTDPPFCGRRGRTRLAVIDGLVSHDVLQLLVGALREDEQLVVCGTALDPDASATLRDLRRGSSAKRIPSSILQEYRQAPRWSPRFSGGGEAMPPEEAPETDERNTAGVPVASTS